MPVTTLEMPVQTSPVRQRVYVKSLWKDSWTEVKGLWASDIGWATLPQIGAARLHWQAFIGTLPHESQEIYHEWQSLDRKLVKILCEYRDDVLVDKRPTGELGELKTRAWYGFFDRDHQVRQDVIRLTDGTRAATGLQDLPATGIEQILDDLPVLEGRYKHEVDNGGGGPPTTLAALIRRAPVFNEGGRPNRSDTKINGCYVFSKHSQGAKFWSTLNIVEYLLTEFPPRTGTSADLVKLQLSFLGNGVLFEWDRPVVHAHGRSVWSILCELMHPRRGLGGYFQITENETQPAAPTPWELVAYSYSPTDVTLNDADPNQKLLANGAMKRVPYDWGIGAPREGRPDLVTVVSRGLESQYDRVVAQGAPMVTCFSSYLFKDQENQDGLVRDWTDAEETEYSEACEGDPDYPSTADDRKDLNTRYRKADRLSHVFSRFKLGDKFAGFAYGFDLSGERSPVYPNPDFLDPVNGTQISNWPLGWKFARTLPLFEGQEYFNTTLPAWPYQTADKPTPEALSPLAFLYTKETIADYNDGPWCLAESHGMNGKAGENWSLHVRVQESLPRLILKAHNAPQHVIGKDHFVARTNAGESDSDAKYDYETRLFVTIALEESRLAEAIYPAELPNFGNDIAVLRTKYIDCGDDYRRDWLVKNTAVAVGKDSKLKFSQKSGYVRDDAPLLMQIARAAFSFYSQPRVSLTLQKPGVTEQLWLGMMVAALGREDDPPAVALTTNSVVTQITVSFPQRQGGAAGPPLQVWTTSHSELDGLEFMR